MCMKKHVTDWEEYKAEKSSLEVFQRYQQKEGVSKEPQISGSNHTSSVHFLSFQNAVWPYFQNWGSTDAHFR